MYPVLQETDPSITAGLEEIMSNPNLPLPPFDSLDTSLMTDATKQFVIHTIICISIIADPSVPNETKYKILAALDTGTNDSAKSRRVMRRGERKRGGDVVPTLEMLNAILADDSSPLWYAGADAQQAPSTDYEGDVLSCDDAVPVFEVNSWPMFGLTETEASVASPIPAAQENGCY
jgi:hypothetical protein